MTDSLIRRAALAILALAVMFVGAPMPDAGA